MVLHETRYQSKEQAESGETNKSAAWIVDPNMDENTSISNNLIQVTIVKDKATQRNSMIVDKGQEALKTSFPNQHGAVGAALSLNFKSNFISLAQMKEAITLATQLCEKAFA